MYCKKRKILTKRKKREILVVVRSSFAHPSLNVRLRFVYGRGEKAERNERAEKNEKAERNGKNGMIGK